MAVGRGAPFVRTLNYEGVMNFTEITENKSATAMKLAGISNASLSSPEFLVLAKSSQASV
jgi:isopentenyl diphosphate isomerase/L-lactate dehydrogenase-like FMN-dependent dehydrogenase